MYLEEGRFLTSVVKQEVAEDTYEDAEEEGEEEDRTEATRQQDRDETESSIHYIAQKLSATRYLHSLGQILKT